MKRVSQFAAHLKELCSAKHLIQRDMARKFHLSDIGYGAWERGDTEPSIDNIIKLCQFFGCTSDILIWLAPPKKTVAASEVKAKSEEAKNAVKVLLASIERLG